MFDTPWVAALTAQISQELQNNFHWINEVRSSRNEKTKMLDYACGNGVVSRALASRIQTARGIDISSGMAKQYDLVARESSFSHEKMHAIQGDLLDAAATPSPELDSEEYKKFDFAIMSLALHHVDHVDGMIRRLAERLDEGGVLVIVDWVDGSEGSKRAAQMGHTHHGHGANHMGFKEQDLRERFEKAGLGNWGWRLFGEPSRVPGAVGGTQQGFLARGTKGK
ncbi:Methyltransferase type 12 [Metarhizium rileyi]|uniref:Methyltransferase type 12 n=1 Tax=Metarhizium rileyi (strain RCEF 4871) TaxID=1649241 RepID=A0A162JGJ7_METRR|nr:Methyltransferase type 12 [Metarhizium rileyi RCEF 4871]TWU73468.1 hypothetical protein ED733_005132 [Metarhizium rileyi]